MFCSDFKNKTAAFSVAVINVLGCHFVVYDKFVSLKLFFNLVNTVSGSIMCLLLLSQTEQNNVGVESWKQLT